MVVVVVVVVIIITQHDRISTQVQRKKTKDASVNVEHVQILLLCLNG